uniref:Uncharacterized protein n=1 Tax=Aegilops tauschii TaxID=37682 RepID=M8C0G8_AEGTA
MAAVKPSPPPVPAQIVVVVLALARVVLALMLALGRGRSAPLPGLRGSVGHLRGRGCQGRGEPSLGRGLRPRRVSPGAHRRGSQGQLPCPASAWRRDAVRPVPALRGCSCIWIRFRVPEAGSLVQCMMSKKIGSVMVDVGIFGSSAIPCFVVIPAVVLSNWREDQMSKKNMTHIADC